MADQDEEGGAAAAADQSPDKSPNQVSAEGVGSMDWSSSENLRWLLHCPFIVHAALVLVFVWVMSMVGMNYPLVYVVGFIFLFLVESRHHEKTVRRIRHEERKHAAQKQLLSDFESVRWLNQTLEKAWPVFLEKFASRDFLAPLMPFFIGKYKPWTVQDAALHSFDLGQSPPFFAGLRAVDASATDDDMVLEASMQFFAADDMSAVLLVQLKKRLGGIWTKLHISKLHIEGKVRLGLKFQEGWPFVSRLRISFDSAPYLQIEARPLTNYGMDMAELPGIASWLDTMLMDALEDSIVKPNMLVINVEKLASVWGSPELISQPLAKTHPVAYAVVEIIEASHLKPADVNGLADPYVKLTLNASRHKTSIKWKTLNPTWKEVFRLPVNSWGSQNRLMFQVRDKDTFRDDNLGYWDETLTKFRDGSRHEVCVPLRGVKTGRLTFAVTVEEVPQEDEEISPSTDMDESSAEALGPDQYEIIEASGVASGIFSILRPGKAVQKKWRGRKGRKVDDGIEVPDKTLFSGSLEAEGESSGSEDKDNSNNKTGRKRFWRWSNRANRDKKGFSGELVTVGESGGQVELRTVLHTADKVEEVPLQLNREEEIPLTAEEPPNLLPQAETKVAEVKTDESEPMHTLDDSSDTQQASPGRRSVRDRARSVVKQAEKTASHIGNSIWKRRSGKLSPES